MEVEPYAILCHEEVYEGFMNSGGYVYLFQLVVKYKLENKVFLFFSRKAVVM